MAVNDTIDFVLAPSFPKEPFPTWVVAAPLCLIAGGTIFRIILNRQELEEQTRLDREQIMQLAEDTSKEYAAYYLSRTMIIPKDDNRVRRIDRILGLLLAANSELINCFDSDIGKWRFNVLIDNEAVAMSFPSGYVFVHQGLINTASTDDELAFALSHELAKVSLRITERELNRRVLPWKILVFALRPVTWQLCTEHFSNLFAKVMLTWTERSIIKIQNQICYDKNIMCECDIEAFKFMTKAGFDPRSVASYMMKLYLQERMSLFWAKRGVPGEIQRGLLVDPTMRVLSLPIPEWRRSQWSSKNRWDMVSWRLADMEEQRRLNGLPLPPLDPRREPHEMAKKMDEFMYNVEQNAGNGTFYMKDTLNLVASPVTAQVFRSIMKDETGPSLRSRSVKSRGSQGRSRSVTVSKSNFSAAWSDVSSESKDTKDTRDTRDNGTKDTTRKSKSKSPKARKY